MFIDLILAFYETDLREFHITFDETNTTQFTLGNTLVTLDLWVLDCNYLEVYVEFIL